MPFDQNTCVIFAKRPEGMVSAEQFRLSSGPVPEPAEGQILIRTIYLSLDPYMRGRMNDRKSYVPPFQVGEVLEGGVIGEVVASRNSKFAEGDIVTGMLGWQSYSLSDGAGLARLDRRLAPLPCFLGVLGMPGMTAWAGLLKIGQPKEGESVFVTAASGAVGSIVGQIAKLKGCRVAGCAGSDAKVDYLTSELGFDAAFNYKTCDSLSRAMAEACPGGIDVYFENVGGRFFEAALTNMNPFGRMPVCGLIAEYNAETPPEGPRGFFQVVTKRLHIAGFIVSDHFADMPRFITEAAGWLREGKLKHHETIVEGLENAPQAFVGLFLGENFGKLLVQVGPE